MKRDKQLVLAAALLLAGTIARAQQLVNMHSPGNVNVVHFRLQNGYPYYQLERRGKLLLDWSTLGLKTAEFMFDSLKLQHTSMQQHNSVWRPVWGKDARIKDNYREYRLMLTDITSGERMVIDFRIYDEGIGIRYEIPRQSGKDSVAVSHDLTAFQITEDATWWAYNGENHNRGPQSLSATHGIIRTPMLLRYHDGRVIAIHEAAISNMAFMSLQADGANKLLSSLPLSRCALPLQTSWRAIMTGDNERRLPESNLLVNLSPPCAIKYPSWIKPGKATWNWRARGYKAADGFTYDIDTRTQERMIDFAAQNSFNYHVIDANWYGPEFAQTANPLAEGTLDVKAVIAYARQRHIGVFLYLNDVAAKQYGIEPILKKFTEWGAVGVKYGFMKGEGQQKVLFTHKVIELCAKYKLMVVFHDDPVPPSGDERTYPNVLAREYGHAQADAKTMVFPETAVNQPFINMLAGPLDFNYGWFDLNNAHHRTRVLSEVPGTIAGELGRLVVIYTGLNCLPDVPEEYEKKGDLLTFIKSLPNSFDDYRVLDGNLDRFIAVGRRSGNNWFIGAITNREARVVHINLGFLRAGKRYRAIVYEDAPDAHFLTNKEAYHIRTLVAQRDETLRLTLATGGGCAVYLKMMN